MTDHISQGICCAAAALAVAALAPACSHAPAFGIRRIAASEPTVPPRAAFWLFSDAHVHNPSSAATGLRSAWADRISPVAIRPPSLDLWAEVAVSELARRVLRDAPELPVMFLGDAADISCIDEYAHFLDALGGELVWFGAIGNHDGHYMGNFTFEPRGAEGDGSWQGACARDGVNRHRAWPFRDRLDRLERALWRVPPGEQSHVDQGVLSKAHAMWLYLDRLHTRGVIAADPLDCDSWLPDGWSTAGAAPRFRCADHPVGAGSYRVFRATGAYRLGDGLHSIAIVAAIDSATVLSPQRTQPWHGYLVQDVELPGGDHAIFIDTSDYLNAPRTYSVAELIALTETASVDSCAGVPSDASVAGACGEVGARQTAELGRMVRTVRARDPGARYFLLGHHPWRALRRDSTDRLAALASSPGFVTYISGHNHQATATLGTGARYHWEVNAASILDWPMQYTRLSSWATPDGPVLRTVVHDLAGPDGDGCAYGGPRDPGATAHAQRELSYASPDAYLTRALEVYRIVIGTLARADRPERCVVNGEPLVLDQVVGAIDAAAALDSRQRRLLLDDIASCDRDILRAIPGVAEIELGCAGWASKLEYDVNGARERIPLSDSAPVMFRIVETPAGPTASGSTAHVPH